MVERLRTIWAQLAILCIASAMSLGALVFCWLVWRRQRRKRIKAKMLKFFEPVGLLLFGPLEEEHLDEWLTRQSIDNSWR